MWGNIRTLTKRPRELHKCPEWRRNHENRSHCSNSTYPCHKTPPFLVGENPR
jgi:hypothetical protein